MLGYDWSTNHSQQPAPPHPTHPPQLILPDDLHHHHHHHHHHDPSTHNHHRPIYEDPFTTPCTFTHDNTSPHHFNQLNTHTTPHFLPSLYDPNSSSFPSSSSFNPLQPPNHHHNNILQHEYSILVPKPDPEFPNRIGLNLGGRTYFASDDDLVSRLYRRTRGGDQLVNTPKCQAEGCNADLTHAKHYHRRHKVCEFHSKASTVVAAGLTQRFCQQCSRFHLLSEFDNGKRSCRKRLADHNRRRRKSHQIANRDQRDPDLHVPPKSPSQSIQRSSDSGANSSSSVTVAISSPLASFESNFRQRSYD